MHVRVMTGLQFGPHLGGCPGRLLLAHCALDEIDVGSPPLARDPVRKGYRVVKFLLPFGALRCHQPCQGLGTSRNSGHSYKLVLYHRIMLGP